MGKRPFIIPVPIEIESGPTVEDEGLIVPRSPDNFRLFKNSRPFGQCRQDRRILTIVVTV
jgi:hypothetical protein